MSDNEVDTLKARLAEVERERDEALERYAEAEQEWEYDCSQRVNDIKRALAAEARVVVLEKALTEIARLDGMGLSDGHLVKSLRFDSNVRSARNALADEQKEAGK